MLGGVKIKCLQMPDVSKKRSLWILFGSRTPGISYETSVEAAVFVGHDLRVVPS